MKQMTKENKVRIENLQEKHQTHLLKRVVPIE